MWEGPAGGWRYLIKLADWPKLAPKFRWAHGPTSTQNKDLLTCVRHQSSLPSIPCLDCSFFAATPLPTGGTAGLTEERFLADTRDVRLTLLSSRTLSIDNQTICLLTP